FDSRIDSIADRIRADVYADPHKPFTNQNFEDNINMNVGNAPGLKSFITNRGNSLAAQLAANGCWVGVNETAGEEEGIFIYPNPATTDIGIKSQESGNKSIEIYDVLGKRVYNSAFCIPH